MPMEQCGDRVGRARRGALGAALAACLAASARADDRQFTFLDMAKVTTPGTFEFEQWIGWEGRTKEAADFSVFTLKEEVEIGVSDKLMFGVDVPEWHFQTGPEDEKQGPRLDTFGGEFRYRFMNPTTEAIGLAVKGEAELGPHTTGLEARVIVQKNFDRFTLVYNARIEAEWAREEDAEPGEDARGHDGEFVQALGGSVELSPNWYIGAEAVHEIPLPEWHTGAQQNMWVGPNLSYHADFHSGRNWALTTTLLLRATDSEEEPLYRFQMIFEMDF